MAKKKISELPAGSALNGSEIVPIVQTGTTKRVTAQDIANLGNASGVEGSGTINYLSKFTASSTIGNSQLFDNGTNIGLGTASPLFPLDVVSNSGANALNIRARVNDDFGLLSFSNNAGNQIISEIYIHRTGNNIGSLVFTTNNGSSAAERMRINASGNVGIGTTSPAALLDINGSSSVQQNFSIANDRYISIYADSSQSIINSVKSVPLIFRTNDAEKMRITSAGNVGIGTTSPTEKLHIKGSGINTQTISLESTISASNSYVILGSTSKSYITGLSTDFSNSYIIYDATASALRLAVTSAGNVGIGTTSPQNKLVISNGGAQGLEIGADATYNVNLAAYNRSSPGYIPFQLDASKISFLTGNVLIGTTTDAGYKLDVNGTARVNAISGYGQFILNGVLATQGAEFNYQGGSIRYASITGEYESSGKGKLILRTFINSGIDVGGSLTIASTGAATFSSSVTATDNIFINGSGNTNVFFQKSGVSKWIVGYVDSISAFRFSNGATDVFTLANSGAATFSSSVTVGNFTTTQINALTPAAGMVVFNTTLRTLCFYDGSEWQKVSHSSM